MLRDERTNASSACQRVGSARGGSGTIAFILRHGEAKVLITDTEFAPLVAQALAQLDQKPVVIDIADAMGPGGERLGEIGYEEFLATGDPAFPERRASGTISGTQPGH